MRKDAD